MEFMGVRGGRFVTGFDESAMIRKKKKNTFCVYAKQIQKIWVVHTPFFFYPFSFSRSPGLV